MPAIVMIAFDDLTIDGAVNARVKGVQPFVVAEYAEARRAGKEFPPGRAFRLPDGTHLLSRGFHRAEAYRQAGEAEFPCEVIAGTREDAILDALGDNANHGLRRNNDDKRNAVEKCLDLRPDWTQEKVAEWCAVSINFVSDILSERAAADAKKRDGEFSSNENSPVRTSRRGRKGEGRKATKQDDAAKVGSLLKSDPTQTNDAIAITIGVKPAFVAKLRKSLEKKGVIEAQPKHDANPPGDEPHVVDAPQEPDTDPCEEFVGLLNRLCRGIDSIKKDIETAGKTPLYGQQIHVESITYQLEAARSALWQSRPTEACSCVRSGEPNVKCKACYGSGKCPAKRVLKGGR